MPHSDVNLCPSSPVPWSDVHSGCFVYAAAVDQMRSDEQVSPSLADRQPTHPFNLSARTAVSSHVSVVVLVGTRFAGHCGHVANSSMKQRAILQRAFTRRRAWRQDSKIQSPLPVDRPKPDYLPPSRQ